MSRRECATSPYVPTGRRFGRESGSPLASSIRPILETATVRYVSPRSREGAESRVSVNGSLRVRVGSVTERKRGGRGKRRVPGGGIIARLQIIGQALPPPSPERARVSRACVCHARTRASVRACSCRGAYTRGRRRRRRQWDVTRLVRCMLRGSGQGWLSPPKTAIPVEGPGGTLRIGVRVVTVSPVSNSRSPRLFSRRSDIARSSVAASLSCPSRWKRRSSVSDMPTVSFLLYVYEGESDPLVESITRRFSLSSFPEELSKLRPRRRNLEAKDPAIISSQTVFASSGNRYRALERGSRAARMREKRENGASRIKAFQLFSIGR